MTDTIYLICNRTGVIGQRKTAPALKKGEIAIKVNVTVPKSVFAEYIPSVDVEISERSIIHPVLIEVQEPES